MKKLWYIASTRIPSERASSFAIMKMCEAFSAEGLNVTLVLPWRLDRQCGNPFTFHGVKETFTIERLFAMDTIGLRFLLGSLAFWIRMLTFRFSLFMARWWWEPDIIYNRDWSLMCEGDILELHKFPSRVTRWHRAAWRKSSAIVVVSAGLKEDLVVSGVHADKIVVAPNGFDPREFENVPPREEARRRLGLPHDKKIATYIGSFQKWKGVDVLLRAAHQVKSDGELLFVIVGGTNDQIEQCKEQYGNPDNVLFVGHKLHKEVPMWLATANVLVLPNMPRGMEGTRYTSPIKMFEYMAARRPIVASNLPSICEHLDEGKAILVPPGDARALVAAIERITDDNDYTRALVVNAAAHVQQYTWRERARRIIHHTTLREG